MKKVTAPVRIDLSGGWPDSDPYRKDFGGAVLNAAINHRVSAQLEAPNLTTSLGDVPRSSGLGTSGALRATYLVASNDSLIYDRMDLIQRVHRFENEIIGQRAGFQDEAAAIYGGINYWEFGQNGSIRRYEIPREQAQHLENHLVLVYIGEDHLSSNIHNLVFGPENYETNIPKLDRMKEIAKLMTSRLSDFHPMACLINETWDIQRTLHSSIETETMRELHSKLKSHYSACRATGAGGGGCMIFYTENKAKLMDAVIELQKEIPKIKPIPFNFDYEGIKIE
jgi:D-glycero-alpha-D-manno-heptose-7-phosphate kinase